MNTQRSETVAKIIDKDALKAVVGSIEDAKAIEVLNLQPTLAELDEAMVWVSDDGDVLSKTAHPISGKVAKIVDILTRDEDDPQSGP